MKERIEKRTRKKKKSIVSRILISNNLEKYGMLFKCVDYRLISCKMDTI